MKKNMMISIFFLIMSFSTFANSLKIPKEGNRIEDFYSGYNLLKVEMGDLNKDGLDDVVLLIEEVGEMPEPGMVDHEAEPAKILVLFKKKNGGYRLVSKNEKLLEKKGMYSYEASIEIKKGVLHVGEAIMSMYHIFNEYTFRFQNGYMELIGLEISEINRGTGDTEDVSINLSTNRMSITKGRIDKDEGDTKWKKTNIRTVYILDNITDELNAEILKEAKYFTE